jgi:hypothetical protein
MIAVMIVIMMMITMMMMMTMTKQGRGDKEESILESACSLLCSLQLSKQDLDKMKENDHNGAVGSNCTPEHSKSNKTTRVMITL